MLVQQLQHVAYLRLLGPCPVLKGNSFVTTVLEQLLLLGVVKLYLYLGACQHRQLHCIVHEGTGALVQSNPVLAAIPQVFDLLARARSIISVVCFHSNTLFLFMK